MHLCKHLASKRRFIRFFPCNACRFGSSFCPKEHGIVSEFSRHELRRCEFRIPELCPFIMIGIYSFWLRDALSAPPARTTSHCPAAILPAAISMAARPEAHWRSSVKAGTLSGKPLSKRSSLPIFPPGPTAFPQMQRSGTTLYLLQSSAATRPPSTSGLTDLKIPYRSRYATESS